PRRADARSRRLPGDRGRGDARQVSRRVRRHPAGARDLRAATGGPRERDDESGALDGPDGKVAPPPRVLAARAHDQEHARRSAPTAPGLDVPVRGLSLPGPRPMPVVGAAGNLVRFAANPSAYLRWLHGRYGDVAALAPGSSGPTFVFSPEYIEFLLGNTE